MEKTARLFVCTRCRDQVVICRACDRGNIYCSSRCSQAARQQRYRQRQKVTHHTSTGLPPRDLLPSVPHTPSNHDAPPAKSVLSCHFCARPVPLLLRIGVLREQSDADAPMLPRWALGP